LADGEDYELLMAFPANRTARLEVAWKRQFPRVPLTRIGELTRPAKSRPILPVRGYDHFA
jgi:thiamine monophosphate kinase